MAKRKNRPSELSTALLRNGVYKHSPAKLSGWKRYRGQTFGPASEVRKIDPKEWKHGQGS